MQEPPSGDGHLLGIIDAAQPVRIGDGVGKGIQMNDIPEDESRQKCGKDAGRALLHPIPKAKTGSRSLIVSLLFHKKLQNND